MLANSPLLIVSDTWPWLSPTLSRRPTKLWPNVRLAWTVTPRLMSTMRILALAERGVGPIAQPCPHGETPNFMHEHKMHRH
jgi:hypothetical protein